MTGTVPDHNQAAENVDIPAELAVQLLKEVRDLRAAFDSKIRYDEVRERLIESMSQELATHRQNLHQMQLRPVLLDLVAMFDDLTKTIKSADCPPTTAKTLEFFRDTIEQTLVRNGVDRFTVEGDTVDRTQQKVINVVETTDPAADRQLVSRLRPGFSWNSRVLRPEWVSAYKYVATVAVVDEMGSDPRTEQNEPADTIETVQVPTHSDEGAPT